MAIYQHWHKIVLIYQVAIVLNIGGGRLLVCFCPLLYVNIIYVKVQYPNFKTPFYNAENFVLSSSDAAREIDGTITQNTPNRSELTPDPREPQHEDSVPSLARGPDARKKKSLEIPETLGSGLGRWRPRRPRTPTGVLGLGSPHPRS